MSLTGSVFPASSTDAAANAGELRLVAAVLRKDRKATAEFVARYSDGLYAYLRRRLIPRVDLAEDLLQEVFLSAWTSLGNFQGRSSLKSWLMAIARHKVEDHYRKRLREPEPLVDEGEGAAAGLTVEPLVDEALDRQRLEARTQKVLASLPESYSAALLWRYWEKRSAKEMAERSGKTVKAVERLLARARLQFKRRWRHE